MVSKGAGNIEKYATISVHFQIGYNPWPPSRQSAVSPTLLPLENNIAIFFLKKTISHYSNNMNVKVFAPKHTVFRVVKMVLMEI